MRVAIYVRVSTKRQSVELQLNDLNIVAQRLGWEIFAIYKDEGFSGASPRCDRPALKALMDASVAKNFDMVAIWSIDRLARSTLDLIQVMSDLKSKSVELYVHKQAIDTTTSSGRLMWQMLGIFAEFERELIKDRIFAGLEKAKANGVKLGRPKISKQTEAKILELRCTGMGMLKIGKILSIGTSQVQRVCSTSNKGELPVNLEFLKPMSDASCNITGCN